MSLSVYTLKDISARQERLCRLLSKNYKSACAICWENIILHSYPEIEISFKFIPKMLMSKECIHFFGPLCIYWWNLIAVYCMDTASISFLLYFIFLCQGLICHLKSTHLFWNAVVQPFILFVWGNFSFFKNLIHCNLIRSDSNVIFIHFGGAFTRKLQKVTFLLCVSLCPCGIIQHPPDGICWNILTLV